MRCIFLPMLGNLSITVAANRWCLSVLLTQRQEDETVLLKAVVREAQSALYLVASYAPGVCLFVGFSGCVPSGFAQRGCSPQVLAGQDRGVDRIDVNSGNLPNLVSVQKILRNGAGGRSLSGENHGNPEDHKTQLKLFRNSNSVIPKLPSPWKCSSALIKGSRPLPSRAE